MYPHIVLKSQLTRVDVIAGLHQDGPPRSVVNSMSDRSERRALVSRLASLQNALSAEQTRTSDVERELAKLRDEMVKRQARPAEKIAAPPVRTATPSTLVPARRYQRSAVTADLVGYGRKPVDTYIMAGRGQLRRKCTDVTLLHERAGRQSNKHTAIVYRPRLTCDITRHFEQYQCSKQSPSLKELL